MSEVAQLPIIFALRKAYVQYEVWLAGIGCGGVLGKVNTKPHPYAGLGVPTTEVAEVYFYGDTHSAWWHRKMYGEGIDSFMQIPFEEGRALSDAWLAERPYVTPSETMRVFHLLRRAEGLGLCERRRERECGVWTWLAV